MKFTVSSAELLKALMDVSKAIPAKSVQPILENFLFVLKDNSLEITASDSDLTLRTCIEVEKVQEEGSIAVPARHFTDLLKALPDQPVSIKTTDEGASFECSWSSGVSTLPFFPAEDYPHIKTVDDDARKVVFPAQTLLDGINGTIYATADDEMRPAMNGIFFDLDTMSSTLVASDSHKLICYTSADVNAADKCSFILHKKAAGVLKGLIGKDSADITVRFDDTNAVFGIDNTVLICRLVVGKFPRYKDVILQNNSNILKMDRVQLLNSVRRVSVCANKASNHIKFDFKPGQLEISAQDLGFAIAAYEKLACDYSGDDLTIGFKSSFLCDILGNMTCDTVVMKFMDARRAALIVPAEEEEDSEKICGILMPIMI